MTDDSIPNLDEIVETQVAFTAFVQLNKAFEGRYRRDCRKAFLPTETEHTFFRAIARAARGELDQGKSNLLLVSPFGTGKTLDLVMIYDIFTSLGNKEALQGFDQWLRNDLQALTNQGSYLVVPVVGTESLPLSQLILQSFRRAIETHPLLKGADPSRPFLVPTVYEKAVQWLQNVDRGNLSYLAAPLDAFLRNHPSHHTRASLERALDANEFEAFEIWRSGFQATTNELPIGFGSALPREVFESAWPELQSRGIVGIALLIDELSQHLKFNARHEMDIIRTLDPLIHWIHNTDNCFSVVATQVIPEQFRGESEAGYQAWASLQGRFHTYPMDRKRYDRLIAKALKRKQNAPIDPDSHPQMQDLCQIHTTCFGSLKEDRETIQKAVAGYYPLHPTVVAAIGYIADTFGQYDRSIFQYLDLKTEDGFYDFIRNHPVYLGSQAERLSLVTLDEIFRFFTRNWSSVEVIDDSLARASKRAEASIQGDPLARRVLNLVTLLSFLDRRATLPNPTLKGIAEMLNVPADQHLEEVLHRFTNEGDFVEDEEFGYQLESSGGPRPIEVERAIQRYTISYKEITGTELVDKLKKYKDLSKIKAAPPFPIHESYEVTVKNLKKKFTRHFVTGRELVERASKLVPGSTQEGTILVATVTRADAITGKLHQEAKIAAGKLAKAGAVVGLVRQPLGTLDQFIKRYEAAKAVAEDRRLGTSEVAKKKLEEAVYQLLTALSKEYEASRLDWYTPMDHTRSLHFDDATLIAEAAAKKLTEKFPDVIAKHDVVGGQINSEVIETLLNGGGQLEMRGLPGRVYTEALAPLGIVSIGKKKKSDPKQTVSLTIPDHTQPKLAESAEMWGIIEAALPLGKAISGEMVYDNLQPLLHPPYWCPENLVVYLLAAYMGIYKAEVRGTRGWDFHQPGIDEVKALVKSRVSCSISLPLPIQLTSDQAALAESIAKAVAARLPRDAIAYIPNTLDSTSPTKALEDIGEDLGRWYRDYGPYASRVIMQYGLATREGQAFLRVVKEASESKRLAAADFYTRMLPSALGFSPHEAPLRVEQIIDGLAEISKMSNEINTAARLRTANEATSEAWDKFAGDCLDKDLLHSLLDIVTKFQASQSSGPKPDADLSDNSQSKQSSESFTTDEEQVANSYRVGANGTKPSASSIKVDPTIERDITEEDATPETVITSTPKRDQCANGQQSRGVSAEDMRRFANFVLTMAGQVQAGERNFDTLEEILRAYRDAMLTGSLNNIGDHSI
jgi:hypothetical protein